MGFAEGTNLIENCIVTATLNTSSDYAGGIVGNGQNSTTTIRGCIFAGTINGLYEPRANVGGIWGYCNGATPTLQNCLEVGTYNNISSMHPIGLQGASGTITNCYYVTPQIGSPDNACTVSGAKQAYTITAGDDVTLSGLGTATGIMYDGTCYAGSGEAVTLTVGHGNKTGYTFSQYTATGGTLANATTSTPTLTMPAADVTIGIDWTRNTHSLADSETTGIITISKESGSQGDDDGWYTLNGRKLSGKSTKKGLYIVNGRKVVVK